MISEFTIENLTTKDIVTFGQEPSYGYLFKDDGLDWGSAYGSHSTYNYPGQIGSYISMTSIKERDITITGYVYYFLTDNELVSVPKKERQAYAYAKMRAKKSVLNSLLNPNDYVKVTIGDYYITGKPSQTIRYGSTGESNNQYFCEFQLSIFCNNPMFKKNTITRTVVSGSKGMFRFPLAIPSSGYILSLRENYLLLNVFNEGDSEIGATISLTAKGVVENPTLENIANGHKITLYKTMQKGEKIVITTVNGIEKGIKGYINGIEYNYFKYWDFENDWMKFPKGTSLVGYSTTNDSEKLLEVTIEINPEKFGLEEM